MALSIDLFQIMGILQAARAVHLGLNLPAAKSWGLNRAIFYTAIRKGYIGRSRKTRTSGAKTGKKKAASRGQRQYQFYQLGGEKAYRSPRTRALRFLIGGRTQTPDQFDRQVKARFPDWSWAWKEALQLIESVPEDNLRKPHRFYKTVYRPNRERLIRRWSDPEQYRSRPTLRLIPGGKRAELPEDQAA